MGGKGGGEEGSGDRSTRGNGASRTTGGCGLSLVVTVVVVAFAIIAFRTIFVAVDGSGVILARFVYREGASGGKGFGIVVRSP